MRHGRKRAWTARATARPAFAISSGPGIPRPGDAASACAISCGVKIQAGRRAGAARWCRSSWRCVRCGPADFARWRRGAQAGSPARGARPAQVGARGVSFRCTGDYGRRRERWGLPADPCARGTGFSVRRATKQQRNADARKCPQMDADERGAPHRSCSERSAGWGALPAQAAAPPVCGHLRAAFPSSCAVSRQAPAPPGGQVGTRPRCMRSCSIFAERTGRRQRTGAPTGTVPPASAVAWMTVRWEPPLWCVRSSLLSGTGMPGGRGGAVRESGPSGQAGVRLATNKWPAA